jgi:hypothetical protein
MMSGKGAETNDGILFGKIVRVVGRAGLAMAGASCGTFVAAQLAKASKTFDSAEVIALTVLLGTLAFYLGIDVPRQKRFHPSVEVRTVDKIDLLSATGTFLAALCALISVYALVFDEDLRSWAATLGTSWALGIVMQISAGLAGRRRPAAP